MLQEMAIDKLIVLFVAETIEAPVQNETLTEICTKNDWVSYMVCKQCISDLIDLKFLVNISKNHTPLYVISSDGKECLGHFFSRIPLSTRDAIKSHIKEYRSQYRRKQEYLSDYFPNPDGSYTVILKINTPSQQLMELKLCVQNSASAKYLYKSWIDKAPSVYEFIYETLLI